MQKLTQKEKEFMTIWIQYLKRDNSLDFSKYLKESEDHKGWLYSHKGHEIRFPITKKESAFDSAMDRFVEVFGINNLVEDDVQLEPLFKGKTISEYRQALINRRDEILKILNKYDRTNKKSI